MAWTVWADSYDTTASLENTSQFQTIQFGDDIVLRAIRTWLVYIGDPVFDNVYMELYSNEVRSGDNTPVDLIATSEVVLKSEFVDEAGTGNIHGVKELPFIFDYVPVNGSTLYNLVINGTNYSPTVNSHLAWMKAFPDPVYDTGYTPAMETLTVAPYQVYAIGAEL